MDIKQIQIFVDLAKSLHFGKTAMQHNMSPSTLSRTIQRIEEELEVALLLRDNRHVELTDSGIHFLDFAEQTLLSWQQLKRSLEPNEMLHGSVSLYCSVTASHSLLDGILNAVRAEHPSIDIKLHTGDQALSLQHLKEGLEDFAIAAKPERLDSNIAFKLLSRTELVFIAPKVNQMMSDVLRRRLNDLELTEVQQLPWIVAEQGLTRRYLNQWFKYHKIKPSIYAQVSGHEAIVSMVALGCGIGLVPELVLQSTPVAAQVTCFKPDASKAKAGFSLPPFEVGLAVLKRRLPEPLINAVWSGI